MFKITTLFENLSYQPGLISGHGLSYLIETSGSKILFDTGTSDALINNARILGIDLSEIDNLVISHGHYDHTGGLPFFLSVNQKAQIYMREDALKEKYKGYDRYIGIPKSCKKERKRFRFVNDIIEISPEVFIVPETPLVNKDDSHFSNFFVRENDGFQADKFTDEQFLVIKGKEQVHIISGCSHRGITNVLHAAESIFNEPPGVVTGGFHLMNSGEEIVADIARKFETLGVSRIEVSHCTGIDQYHFLRKYFPGRVFYNHAGKVVVVD